MGWQKLFVNIYNVDELEQDVREAFGVEAKKQRDEDDEAAEETSKNKNKNKKKKKRKDKRGKEEPEEWEVPVPVSKKKKKTESPPTPKAKNKRKKADEDEDLALETPEKPRHLPRRVDQCRPADFGRRPAGAPCKLAKAGTRPMEDSGMEEVVGASKSKKRSREDTANPETCEQTTVVARDAADKELNIAEDLSGEEDEIVGPYKIQRKRRKRSCRKLQPSEDKIKMQAVKRYFSFIGLAYGQFLQMHARLDIFLYSLHRYY